MDELLLQESNNVCAEAEAHENIKPDLDDNDLYQIDNTSLDDKI